MHDARVSPDSGRAVVVPGVGETVGQRRTATVCERAVRAIGAGCGANGSSVAWRPARVVLRGNAVGPSGRLVIGGVRSRSGRESAGARRRGSEVVAVWSVNPSPQRGRGERLAAADFARFGNGPPDRLGRHPIAGGKRAKSGAARTRWGNPSRPALAVPSSAPMARSPTNHGCRGGRQGHPRGKINLENRKAGREEDRHWRQYPVCPFSCFPAFQITSPRSRAGSGS